MNDNLINGLATLIACGELGGGSLCLEDDKRACTSLPKNVLVIDTLFASYIIENSKYCYSKAHPLMDAWLNYQLKEHEKSAVRSSPRKKKGKGKGNGGSSGNLEFQLISPFDYNLLLFTMIYNMNHWQLIVLYPNQHEIEIIDSWYKGCGYRNAQLVFCWLMDHTYHDDRKMKD